eukprot:1403192-Pyramimonas_sp.AAC.1
MDGKSTGSGVPLTAVLLEGAHQLVVYLLLPAVKVPSAPVKTTRGGASASDGRSLIFHLYVKGSRVDVKGSRVDVKDSRVDVKGSRVDGKGCLLRMSTILSTRRWSSRARTLTVDKYDELVFILQ